MKLRFSKIAFVAALAFIGFANTQNAQAALCPNVDCNTCDAKQTARYADCNKYRPYLTPAYVCTKTIKSSYVHCDPSGSAQPVCVNCDGTCPGNRYMVDVDTYSMVCPACDDDSGSAYNCVETVPQFSKGAYGTCDAWVAYVHPR